MQVRVELACETPSSFRVPQVRGMFDLPDETHLRRTIAAELPGLDEPWRIGAIVGPSGSGKSTIARQAFGDCLYGSGQWPTDRAVVDCFGETPLREVIELLTAVGFSSPPSWVKPYQVLSCGEKFRCDLARALAGGDKALGAGCQARVGGEEELGGDSFPQLSPSASRPAPPIVAFDEFTSVVDRNVARASSAAIAKGIRSGHIRRRFVAVTCHYDVAEWLEADWVLDMATQLLTRRRLRRPPLVVEIHRSGMGPWVRFARHHYLSGQLAPGARCYLATWNGEPVTTSAGRELLEAAGFVRDYQGMTLFAAWR